MSDKIDFKKTFDGYGARRGQFRILDLPDVQYLMIDGHGDPNSSPAFAEAIESIYPVAYQLKFASRRQGRDYVVPPLEGLWWADDMETFTTYRDKSRWDWTLMVMAPEWIDRATFITAAEEVKKKGSARADDVRFEALSEGRCVQTLHVGSFDDEGELLAALHHQFIPGQGLRIVGKHHEIYLSDFRRVPPERRRTILRQPVRKATAS